MVKPIRRKEVIGATVSPWVKTEALKLVETGEFSSLSDLVSVAITRFITEYNAGKTESMKTETRKDAVEEHNNRTRNKNIDFFE